MSRKTCVRRLLVTVLCMTLALGSFAIAGAKTSDVTKTFKDKKKVIRLCKEFNNWTGYQLNYVLKKGDTKTIAASKADRVKLIKMNQKYMDGKKLQKVSLRLFGVKTNKKVKAMKGDWGETAPVLSNVNIMKVSAKKFIISADVMMEGMNANKTKLQREKIGKVKFTVMKNRVSSYGYVMKKIVVTR